MNECISNDDNLDLWKKKGMNEKIRGGCPG